MMMAMSLLIILIIIILTVIIIIKRMLLLLLLLFMQQQYANFESLLFSFRKKKKMKKENKHRLQYKIAFFSGEQFCVTAKIFYIQTLFIYFFHLCIFRSVNLTNWFNVYLLTSQSVSIVKSVIPGRQAGRLAASQPVVSQSFKFCGQCYCHQKQ